MTDTLKAKLALAQKAMKNPALVAENPHFHSKFAPLPEVLAVIKAALFEQGLGLIQPVVCLEGGMAGIETRIFDATDEKVLGTFPFVIPSDPQKYLAAVTYYRRGSLAAAFALAGEEDDDGNTAAAPEKAKAAPKAAAKPPAEDMLDKLRAAAKNNNTAAATTKALKEHGVIVNGKADPAKYAALDDETRSAIETVAYWGGDAA